MVSGLKFKQALLGGWFGDAVIRSRALISAMQSAITNLEGVGTLANDQLATVLLPRLCKQGTIFVDVGAHIGSVTAAVLNKNPNVRIEAVEAIPDRFRALAKKFPTVKCHGCAVSDHEGEATFFVDTKQSACSFLPSNGELPDPSLLQIQVPIRMLDNLIESDTVDFIKIDVEGAELGVLRGSKRIIEACRPLIMFESGFGSARNSVSSRESIWDFFDERGYQIVVPNRLAHEDSGLSRAGFVESHVYPRRTTNYFAVPEERRGEFRDRAQAALCSTAFLSKNARKQFTRQSKVSPPSSSTGA